MKRPVVLLVLDGVGYTQNYERNAFAQSSTPTLQSLKTSYPYALLQASAMSVGLPWGTAGNSEVGHLCMGSGRIIYQNLPRISVSIQNGSFFSNDALTNAIDHTKEHNSNLHIMGLVGPGSVHSNFDHLKALVELASQKGVSNLYIHAFTDGRDSGVNEGKNMLERLTEFIKDQGTGEIATVMGRFYAMDRDKNWDRTKQAFDCITHGKGEHGEDYATTLQNYYDNDTTDEYIPPTVLNEDGLVAENDAIVFFNFREDRARQITKAFALPSLAKFERELPENLYVTTMVRYEDQLPVDIAFPPRDVQNTLPQMLSEGGKTQLHTSETEKYAHVTYFFNGGKEQAWDGEEWSLVASSGAKNYNETPEMQAAEIAQKVQQAVKSGEYDFVLANFANPDMVGHTGDFEAAKEAMEFVDQQIGTIWKTIQEFNGILLITSDHGNCEDMFDMTTGKSTTNHTTNPVPVYLAGHEFEVEDKEAHENYQLDARAKGILADIAPTILDIFGLEKPEEMTGYSLLKTLDLVRPKMPK